MIMVRRLSGWGRRALALSAVVFWVGCSPAQQAGDDPMGGGLVGAGDPGPLLGGAPVEVFPPREQAEAQGDSPEPLLALIEQAEARRPARASVDKAPAIKPLGVVAATGAPGRSQEGDYRRFKALSDLAQAETVERGAAITIRFDRPVVGAGQIGEPPAEAGRLLDIWPSMEGRMVWSAIDALTFHPKGLWEPGQAYFARLARVPVGEVGVALVEDFEWRFVARDDRAWVGNKALSWEPEADKPRLVGWWPPLGSQLADGQRVAFIFDQPVDAEQVRDHIDMLRLRHPSADPTDAPFDAIGTHLRPVAEAKFNGHDFPADHVLEVEPAEVIAPGQAFEIVVTDAILSPNVVSDEIWWMRYERPGPLVAEPPSCHLTPCPTDPRDNGMGCTAPCGDVITTGSNASITFTFNNPVKKEAFLKSLRVTPPPLGQSHYAYGDTHTVYLDLAPGRTSRVEVAPGLSDVHGFKLARAVGLSVKTRDLTPSMSLRARAGVIEASGRRALPLSLTNVASLSVRGLWIPAERLSDWAQDFELRATSGLGDVFIHGPGVITDTLKTGIPANRLVDFDLSLARFGAGPGVLALEIIGTPAPGGDLAAQLGAATLRERAMVQITDLGLVTRQGPGDLLTWVTALSTGAPLKGVEVELRDAAGRVAAQATTDDKGLARFDRFDAIALPVTVVARRADDHAFTRLLGPDGPTHLLPSARRAMQPAPLEGRLLAQAFTERGIYRPGQQVFFKMLAREMIGEELRAFAREPLTLEISDPSGEVALEHPITLSALGGADFTHTLPERAALGTWSHRLSLRSSRTTLTWGSFRVEEYRPPRFEVKVAASSAEIDAGGKARVEVEGRYLFGAPMAGASAEWTMERWPTSMWANGLDSFSFRDPRREHEGREQIAGRRQPLDPNGRLTIEVDAASDRSQVSGPWRTVIDVEVQDIDRQTVAGRTWVTVHDRDTYLGLRHTHRLEALNTPMSVEVVAVSPSGDLLAGVVGRARLLHVEWNNVERRGPGGSYTMVSEEVIKEEASCQVRTLAPSLKALAERPKVGLAGCRFVPKATGQYMAVVEGRDGKGRPISAGSSFYVYGEGYTSWRADEPEGTPEARLELVPDKEAYEVGEEARLLIKSPWRQAWALVTIEREAVLSERVVFLDGASQIVTVPITEGMAPNFYARISVVRGRVGDVPDGEGNDRMAPSSREGTATIWVRNQRKVLDVAVALDREQARPGEPVEVSVSVTDADGQPARGAVTLWAVDEAVLQLTSYSLPEIGEHFWSHRRLQVLGQDSRDDLLSARIPRLGRGEFGGDGTAIDPMSEVERAQVRRNFKTTIAFEGELALDAQGKATAKVALPDNLTLFRFMAVAADERGRFGEGFGRLRVRKPLMIRPALPRFVTVGDAFELSATVFNGTGADGEVEVAARVQGVTLSGSTSMKIPVKAGENVEVRLPASAPRLGDAVVSLSARLTRGAEVEQDAVEVPLTVQYPGQWIRAWADGAVDDAARIPLDFPASTRPDVGELELQVSTTVLAGLSGTLEQLIEYPYGCVEQTTSRTYPLVMMQELLPDLGLRHDRALVRQMAQAGVDRLLSMVTSSGGLAYWPGEDSPHAYGTAYGLTALVAAREKGFHVPKDVIEEAGRYLTEQLSNEALAAEYGMGAYDTTRAFLLYALALAGQQSPGAAELMSQRRDLMSTDALGFLLLALHHKAGDPALIEPVKAALVARFEIVNNKIKARPLDTGDMSAIFYDDSRPISLSLLALSKVDPRSPLTTRLALSLMDRREGGHWLSTHGNLWALAAMVAYSREVEGNPDVPNFVVKLGGDIIHESLIERLSPRTALIRLPMDKLIQERPDSIEIARPDEHPGRIYYSLKARYLRGLDAIDEAPAASGLAVYRTYEALDGSPLAANIPAGDVVRVKLHVSAKKYLRYVALDDPLPAGLEPINLNLAISGTYAADNGGRYTSRGLLDGSWSFYHSEQRDDRVLYFADSLPPGLHELSYLARATSLGRFTAAPARAEAMYDPSIWGRSAMARIEVR